MKEVTTPTTINDNCKSIRLNKSKFWKNDSIGCLAKVGGRGSITYDALSDEGINTVDDLIHTTPDNLPKIRGIRQLHSYAKENALDGSCPDACEFDHRTTTNPYESKYGDTWLEQMRKCTALSPFSQYQIWLSLWW